MNNKIKFLHVNTKSIVLPNNKKMDIEYITHPGAVLIVPFLDDEKIVMIKQFRPTVEEYLYELPAGTIDKNEDMLDCAKREIIEEIGYRANNWDYLNFIYPCPGYSTEKIFIYKATDLEVDNSLSQDDEEIIEKIIVSKKDVKKFFLENKIFDSKTIAAFSYVGWI